MKIISKQDLLKYDNYLTVGDLKKFIEQNELRDDSLVLIQRVEDNYYENHNWGVYLKDGEHSKEFPEDIAFKEQYHPAWCCVRYKDDSDVLFIDLHY